MELRAHGEADAIATPTGLIPLYDDLKRLFKETLGKDYSRDDYVRQFTIRVPGNLAKIQRVTEFHRTQSTDTPAVVFDVLEQQRQRLETLQQAKGDNVSPLDL